MARQGRKEDDKEVSSKTVTVHPTSPSSKTEYVKDSHSTVFEERTAPSGKKVDTVPCSPLKKKKIGASPLKAFVAPQKASLFYFKTKVENVSVLYAFKEGATTREFAYQMPFGYLVKQDRSILTTWGDNVIDYVPARLEEDTNVEFTYKNSKQTEYTGYVTIIAWDEEDAGKTSADDIIKKNCVQLAENWTKLAKPEAGHFKYPMCFQFCGEKRGKNGEVDHLSRHLLDCDCIRVMKLVYGDIDTKDELMSNEDRKIIFDNVFGSEEMGLSVLAGVSNEEYLVM